MIFDSLARFDQYADLHPGFRDVYLFLIQHDLSDLPCGRIELDHGIYLGINEYETKNIEDCKLECHKKYIDIQIILQGKEKMGIAFFQNCIPEDYQEEKDLQFLNGSPILMDFLTKSFFVFFPHDAHMPCLHPGSEPVEVKKAVFKVPVMEGLIR